MENSLLSAFFDEMKVSVRFVMEVKDGPTQPEDLKQGAICMLATDLRYPVRMDLEGQPIGRGELVNIDGCLGVRVSQLEE